MAAHRENIRPPDSKDALLKFGRDAWVLMRLRVPSPCTPDNDPVREGTGLEIKKWDCRLPFLLPKTLPAGSSSWVSKDVAGLGIEGPVCFRVPARAD